jgi:hypothetical protein
MRCSVDVGVDSHGPSGDSQGGSFLLLVSECQDDAGAFLRRLASGAVVASALDSSSILDHTLVQWMSQPASQTAR